MWDQTGEAAQKRGLAVAIGANQGKDGFGLNFQSDSVQDRLFAIACGKVLDVEQCCYWPAFRIAAADLPK
jgi:hypothetical protein